MNLVPDIASHACVACRASRMIYRGVISKSPTAPLGLCDVDTTASSTYSVAYDEMLIPRNVEERKKKKAF